MAAANGCLKPKHMWPLPREGKRTKSFLVPSRPCEMAFPFLKVFHVVLFFLLQNLIRNVSEFERLLLDTLFAFNANLRSFPVSWGKRAVAGKLLIKIQASPRARNVVPSWRYSPRYLVTLSRRYSDIAHRLEDGTFSVRMRALPHFRSEFTEFGRFFATVLLSYNLYMSTIQGVPRNFSQAFKKSSTNHFLYVVHLIN